MNVDDLSTAPTGFDWPVPPAAPADDASGTAAGVAWAGLATLLERQRVPAEPPAAVAGVVIGEVLAVLEGGAAALVRCAASEGTPALRAASIVDLRGAHVGRRVLLMFEQGRADRPVVMGVLRGQPGWPEDERPPEVQVDADGERMVVTAREQLVLRCGKASITLTKAGKVLIEGSYLQSRSTGVNRVKGGSIQLN